LLAFPLSYVAFGFASNLDWPCIQVIAWIGVPVVGTALWLFRRSHADLGRNWSVNLKLRDGHELVSSGVYRLIRRPMYTSFFLLGVGQFLLLPNWLAGCTGLVGVAILYGFRVVREERMMLSLFDGVYRTYMARTKRIIPWIY